MDRDKMGPTSMGHDAGAVNTAIDTNHVAFDIVDDARSGKPRADRVHAINNAEKQSVPFSDGSRFSDGSGFK